MYAYCGGNTINSVDPSGHCGDFAIYASGTAALCGVGAANCWNPVGWIILAVVVVLLWGWL